MAQIKAGWWEGLKANLRILISSWRSLIGLFVATLAVTLAVNACSITPKLQPLKIGITTWPGFDIVLYAQATDLFKKHGLDVEFLRFENQQDSSRAVLRGSLDAAFASLWDVVQVDPGNDKPTVLLVTNISHGADGIVTQPGIKSVADLQGKHVGAKLGTVNHLILLEALKLHHIPPDAVTIEDISNDSAVEQITKGHLDAAVIWEPLLSDTAAKIKGHVVYTTRDLNSLVIDTLMSRATTVAAKKAEFTQFISVWLDVMHAVDTQPQTVYEQVGKQLGQNAESFKHDYAGLKKGDITLERQMFQDESGLKHKIAEMAQLLREDPRAGRSPREDLDINAEPVMAAIEGWKP